MAISADFKNGSDIPVRYTCRGANTAPELTFTNVPAKAKTLLLIVDDPDAPYGVWTHWTIWNIPAALKTLKRSALPKGVTEGRGSSGKIGYDGPCPPARHRYYFRLYALDGSIDAKAEASSSELMKKAKGHILAEAQLMGYFGK